MAKLEGKFMNHSLQATSASRMYEFKIPEQIIKEVAGHHSDCVRVYKKPVLKNFNPRPESASIAYFVISKSMDFAFEVASACTNLKE